MVAAVSVVSISDVTADSTASVDYATPVDAQDFAAATPVRGATAKQKALVGALNGSRGPEDLPPASLIDWQAKSVGAQRHEAVLLGRASDGSRVFAVPAKAGVCLTGDSYLFNTCMENDAIELETTVQGVVCSPFQESDKLTAFGLLPDHVKSVQAEFANGESKTVPVSSNFLEFAIPKDGPALVRVTWAGADGTQHVDTPFPKDAASVECAARLTPAQAAAEAKNAAIRPPTE